MGLADGTLCLPDVMRIFQIGRMLPYKATMQVIKVMDQHVVIPVKKNSSSEDQSWFTKVKILSST